MNIRDGVVNLMPPEFWKREPDGDRYDQHESGPTAADLTTWVVIYNRQATLIILEGPHGELPPASEQKSAMDRLGVKGVAPAVSEVA